MPAMASGKKARRRALMRFTLNDPHGDSIGPQVRNAAE
jgi:hypothetical protein